MNINDAARVVTDECGAIEGVEINFTDEGPEIYWENLRVQCRPKDLSKAMKAIKTLAAMGAYFG